MRSFVTGADGFVGQWLLRALLDHDDDLAGTSRTAAPALTILSEKANVRWYHVDVRDAAQVTSAIAAERPEVVYHLAAQAHVPTSVADPLDTVLTNVLGTVNLLEACRTQSSGARVIVVGSSEVYGAIDAADLPLSESAPLRPHSPYAGSKAAAEMVALQYARAGWLHVTATRSFNHTGPGQSTAFVAPAFAAQVAAIKAGRQPAVVRVGNLAAKRDLSDVRDVVAAYWLIAQRGKPGAVYNVCSGTAVSARDILDGLLRLASVEADIEEDPARMRPVDTPVLYGDASLLHRDTGWRHGIPLSRTLADLLQWHLQAAA